MPRWSDVASWWQYLSVCSWQIYWLAGGVSVYFAGDRLIDQSSISAWNTCPTTEHSRTTIHYGNYVDISYITHTIWAAWIFCSSSCTRQLSLVKECVCDLHAHKSTYKYPNISLKSLFFPKHAKCKAREYCCFPIISICDALKKVS